MVGNCEIPAMATPSALLSMSESEVEKVIL
jgi:hypothetical protein